MSSISVAIFDSFSHIFMEGIEALLVQKEDIKVIGKYDDLITFSSGLLQLQANILIIGIYKDCSAELELISRINSDLPRLRTLVISMELDENIVFSTIKAGAKGYINKNSGKEELYEAVYTLRGGYEYYNKSITNILLKNYLGLIKNNEQNKVEVINTLSKREIEIIKCWGDGLTNHEISDKLFISVRTVESHKNHIMQKLNLRTSVDLVKYAIKNNLIQI
jgi:DNA-binding NarL/FixJ family response regulator